MLHIFKELLLILESLDFEVWTVNSDEKIVPQIALIFEKLFKVLVYGLCEFIITN